MITGSFTHRFIHRFIHARGLACEIARPLSGHWRGRSETVPALMEPPVCGTGFQMLLWSPIEILPEVISHLPKGLEVDTLGF